MLVPVFFLVLEFRRKGIPNGIKLSRWFFLDQKTPRRLGVQARGASRRPQGWRARLGGGVRSRPCGPLVAPPTYFFLLYIPTYPETIQEHHENLIPPPQPSLPMRSHLGAFSGAPPEGASIMEGFYINTMASPMSCE